MNYEEFCNQSKFSKEEILAFGHGRLVTDLPDGARSRLPIPPMLMFDRIVEISRNGNRGRVVAEQDIQLDSWFFQCGDKQRCVSQWKFIDQFSGRSFSRWFLRGPERRTARIGRYRLCRESFSRFRADPCRYERALQGPITLEDARQGRFKWRRLKVEAMALINTGVE